MARILIGDQWFHQLAATSLYEAEYERLLLAYREYLFPRQHLIPFRPLIQSEHGSARPDLALVDRRLRAWWVIEVELSIHSLRGHVLPQVEVLANGRYSTPEARILAREIPELSDEEALDLVKGSQPRVVVIANESKPNWCTRLAGVGVDLMIVEVFRSDLNQHGLRLIGSYPEIDETHVSVCTADPVIEGLLSISSPAAIGIGQGNRLEIEIDGSMTEWQRIDVQDAVWLKPCGANPLEGRQSTLNLYIKDDGTYILQ